jgi:AGZA family xanthine/uracil permease-like MFS transporter
MSSAADGYFEVKDRRSTLATEVMAGVATYLSLAYIFVVNPAILSQAGMDVSAVLFATVIASGVSTIVMGLWARLPFALAPGLEMNGFFAFAVVGTMGLTWQQALGTVFWSGILCIVFTWLPVRQKIIASIPDKLKVSIAFSVGVFVMTIGLFLAKIVAFDKGLINWSAFSPESLATNKAMVLYFGLVLAALLGIKRLNFPGGMLVAIIASTILCKFLGITVSQPAELSPEMFSALFQLDLWSILDPRFFAVLIIFFIIDFYGSIGKFIGLTAATNLQANGEVKNIEKALYVDGGGTVLGSLVGTSSIITYVESAVGIAAGGRTGIVAMVCGTLMLASIVFTPLVGLVPVEATAGILAYVGWLLLPREQIRASHIEFGRFDWAVAIGMGLLTFLTFSLDKPLLFGFWAYQCKSMWSGQKTNWYLLSAAVALSLAVVAQHLQTP